MNTKLVLRPAPHMTPARLQDTRNRLIFFASMFTDGGLAPQCLPYLVPLNDVIVPDDDELKLARVLKHSIRISKNVIRFEVHTQNVEDEELTVLQFPAFPQRGVFTAHSKLMIEHPPGPLQMFFVLGEIIEELYGKQGPGLSRAIQNWIRRVMDFDLNELTISFTLDGLEAEFSNGKTGKVGLTRK